MLTVFVCSSNSGCEHIKEKKVYLSSKQKCTGNIHGVVVSKARVFEGVSVEQVSRLGRELNSARSGGSSALHKEGVVISDNVPNKSLGHDY